MVVVMGPRRSLEENGVCVCVCIDGENASCVCVGLLAKRTEVSWKALDACVWELCTVGCVVSVRSVRSQTRDVCR
jgi:hypothetical protein